MSAPHASTAPTASAPQPGAILCPRCGHVLAPEQGWCLHCGLAARTRIHPPPSWRIPFVTTLVLLALLAAGISLALVALLDDHATSSSSPAAVTTPATTPTSPTTGVPSTTTPGTSTPPPTSTTPGSVPSGTVPPLAPPSSSTVPGTTTP